MIRFSRNLLLATCLVVVGAVAGTAQMGEPMGEPMGEHDGPPMLVLMPPPDVDKPEGVEMSDNPEEAFHQIFGIFFDMMDQDGNGELNHDELAGWVHPPPHMDGGGMDDGGMHDMDGGGMDGPPMEGDAAEHIRRLEEELHRIRGEQHMRRVEELSRHRDHLQEQIGQMRQEQARMAQHLQEMEENARRVAEELEQAHSQPPMDGGPPMGDDG